MNVAFIPARGGSKSIPMKNIKIIAGKPLIYWAVKAACDCEYIDKVFVSTDCEKIADTVREFNLQKVIVIGRSVESATDTASTEIVMLEFARDYMFKIICLLQSTTPLVTAEDLEEGFKTFNQENVDSVISVVNQKHFIWEEKEDGFSIPINFDYKQRPRRQDYNGYLVENGAFFITSRDALLKNKCRISGNIKTVLMSLERSAEIDEPEDWILAERYLEQRQLSL
ncbi:MAG: acylneuraminate cytidylyltransferase family protein [Oscillospiraceae bacterium]|jgi:N-acylneuraminate cytidylyltransferase|nr:acylneuraminate cytidylyltransferase family protein [Oscillospiraceae bacterium]